MQVKWVSHKTQNLYLSFNIYSKTKNRQITDNQNEELNKTNSSISYKEVG